MVQEAGNRLFQRIALIAALMLAAGIASAEEGTNPSAGAAADTTVKPVDPNPQKGGVSVAAGDITGDGKDFKEERKHKLNPLTDPPGLEKRKKPMPDVAKGPKEPRVPKDPRDPKPIPDKPGKPIAKPDVPTKPEKPIAKPDVPTKPIAKPELPTRPVEPIKTVKTPVEPTPKPLPQPTTQIQAKTKQEGLLLPAVQKAR